MTIKYLDSKRISALSSDFPTTTTSYNHIADTGDDFLNLHDTNRYAVMKILSGSPAIGTSVQKIKISMRKVGTPAGTFKVGIWNASDVLVISVTNTASSFLTTSYVDYEFDMGSATELLLDYKVGIEYLTGVGVSNRIDVEIIYATTETGYSKGYPALNTGGVDLDILMSFDSTPVTISKPTNVQDNSILVEKDTGRRYWFDAESVNTWLDTDGQDGTGSGQYDGSNTNTGSSISWQKYDETNDEIDFYSIRNDNTKTAITKDITVSTNGMNQALSTSSWVLRYQVRFDTFQPNGDTNIKIRLTSFDRSTASNDDNYASGDGMSNEFYNSSTPMTRTGWGSNEAVDTNAMGSDTTISASAQTFYVEWIRNGTALTCNISTSAYGGTDITQNSATVDADWGVTRPLKFFGLWEGSGTGKTAILQGAVHDMQITSTTPATWTNPVCVNTISSTSTLGTAADMDTDVGSPSKSNSGLDSCNAWDFNGTNMAVKGLSGTTQPHAGTTVWTVAGWINSDNVTTLQTIFAAGSSGVTGVSETRLEINTSGYLQVSSTNHGVATTTTATTNAMSVNTWYHIALIHNGTTQSVYVNAVTGSKGTGTGESGSTTAEDWSFGAHITGGTAYNFYNGSIDSMTLWDIALSEANITTLYNSGIAKLPTVSTDDIVAYWNFSETTGSAVNKAV